MSAASLRPAGPSRGRGLVAGHARVPSRVVAAAASLAAAGCAGPPEEPRTALGRALAVALVVLAGALVAGPVGIVATEVWRAARAARAAQACARCGAGAHDADAAYCRRCGARLAARAAMADAGRPTP